MWVTYIMQREWIPEHGEWRDRQVCQYRIGITRNLAQRCEQQRATAGWILSKHEDEWSARVDEILISADYGIPQLSFTHSDPTQQYHLDTLWCLIDSSINQERGYNLVMKHLGAFEAFSYVNYERTNPPPRLRLVLKETGMLR